MSPRQMFLRAGAALFAIIAILFSITSAASDWSIVTEYLRLGEALQKYDAPLTPSVVTARPTASIGVCNTAGPIEVESTGGITVPTAYSSLNVAFANIGIAMHTGSIVIEVCGNTVETTTATLTASGIGSASYTDITIRPVGGPRIIEGNVNAAIIRLQGADNVVIDGRQNGAGTARDLTVRNNNTGGTTAAIWLSSVAAGNGASNNVIRNLEIAAGATQNTLTANTFGIIMSGAAMGITTNGVDNDNNSFIANRIIRARYGILTRGTAASDLNQNPVVTDNIIGPTSFGPDEIGKAGIFMQADTGAVVARNVVQFVGGDFGNTTGGADRVGIGIGAETWSSNTASATTLTSNTYTVTGNIVHDIWDQRQSSAVGINLGTTGGGSPTNNLVANNVLYNIVSNGLTVDQAVGIGIQGGHTDRVVFNSIAMTGDMDGSGATSAAVYGSAIRVGTTASTHANLTLKNNSIYMDVNSNTSTIPYFAITVPSSTYSWGTGGADNNNYFANLSNAQMNTGGISATSTAPSGGSVFNTLAQWKTAFSTPQDANSIQADPLYVSNASDLHIQFASPNQAAAASITGVTDDIDGESRSAAPDIGADESIAATLPGSLQLSTNTYSAAESAGNLVMSVTRSGGSDGDVSAQITFTNSTAIGGATCGPGIDYINLAVGVNFAGGDSAPKTVNVPICGDALDEPNETFTATLGSPTGGATIGAISSATNTVTDDDAAPTVAINDGSRAEGNAGSANIVYVISLSSASGFPVSVDYTTTTGTATTADNDFTAVSGTVAIPAGSQFANVLVPVIGDTKFEADETFNVDLSNAANATITDSSGLGTIVNDDGAPTVAIDDVTQVEGDSGTTVFTFTITQPAVTGVPTSINYATAGGTATAGSDYVAAAGTATIPAGAVSTSVTITVNGDTMFEPGETFFVNLSGGSGYTAAGSDLQGQATITNDDSAPTLSINDNAQIEGSVGTANMEFTISLSAVSGQAVTVNYATANGTATAADNDYMAASGTATILPGNLTANVVVPVIGDNKFEASEVFTVELSGGSNYTASGSDLQGQGTITNDDLAPTVSVNDVSVGEGDSGISFMQFTVALSSPSGLPVSINYASANGTATAGSDYIATTGAITLGSGETLIQVTVQVTGDTVPEQNETVLFDLSGGSGYTAAGSDLQGQGTILNDDSAAVVKALWVFGDSIVPHPVTTPEGRARLIARSSAAGVNRLYVSVWQSAANTSGRHMREESEVAALIAAAHAAGQEVWAAYGDPAWPAVTAGCPAGSSPVIYMNEVGAYNASRAAAEERFDGVMLDVEPGPVTEGDFQALIAHHECMRASLDPSVKLGSAISAFWDDDPVMYPPAAGGSVKPAAHHLIDLPLDQIVVMGYRDTAGTDTCPSSNGIICLDKNEIDYAASVNKAGLVVAGIETLPLPPADDNVTFAEEGNIAMDAETQIVDTYFSTSMGFGGFAIHNYNAMYLSGLPGWPTLIPTAASSTLTGRVADASGAALSNVSVTIEGGGLSAPVSTRTNSFGNYAFADLATGHVYIITVSSRRYAFAHPTRAVSVNDNVTGVDFTAEATQ